MNHWVLPEICRPFNQSYSHFQFQNNFYKLWSTPDRVDPGLSPRAGAMNWISPAGCYEDDPWLLSWDKRKIDQPKTVQFFAHHLHIPSKLEILEVVLGSVLSHWLMRMQNLSPGSKRNKTRTVKVVFLLPP